MVVGSAAHFHIMTDALTSILAILALLAVKYFGLVWKDPVMGVVGVMLVTRWSYGHLGCFTLSGADQALCFHRFATPSLYSAGILIYTSITVYYKGRAGM